MILVAHKLKDFEREVQSAEAAYEAMKKGSDYQKMFYSKDEVMETLKNTFYWNANMIEPTDKAKAAKYTLKYLELSDGTINEAFFDEVTFDWAKTDYPSAIEFVKKVADKYRTPYFIAKVEQLEREFGTN